MFHAYAGWAQIQMYIEIVRKLVRNGTTRATTIDSRGELEIS